MSQVLVVGAGPVGLALALDLGWRGVDVALVEQADGSVGQPKMDMVNVRTMEFCRRWGIADRVRAAGFPQDHPQDIVYSTGVLGYELKRDFRPCMAQEPIAPYSPTKRERCPQNFFDPVLMRAVREQPTVDLRLGHRLADFRDMGDRVIAQVEDLARGRTIEVVARYLVACDGAGSPIRRALGIGVEGRDALSYSMNVLIRSPALTAAIQGRRAYRYVLIDPKGLWGSLVAIDGRDVWRLSLIGGGDRRSWSDADINAAVLKAFGARLPYDVLSAVPWTRREILAETYRRGQCFLAGDAAHQMSPTGGYGMNTGIGDAVDLSWKLAACLEGWGGEGLLASYDIERRPVARRAMEEATANLGRMGKASADPDLLAADAAGDRVRRVVGERVAGLMAREWQSIGIHIGYRYDASPICSDEPGPRPPMEVTSYTQTGYPGARAPHVWLPDGRSTLDLFGRGFVVLDLGATPGGAEALVQAANECGVPCHCHLLADPAIQAVYGAALAIVRPDGHVAWRGDEPPAVPLVLWERLRGATSSDSSTTMRAMRAL
ncbi:FAD-dependent monooxygenase [Phenylobacterium sp.]|uniref:FAD-dependent monooxygenase n=1 Tax=Phenylobacterium sp. TaxID=1871053 RepID=UPI0035ADC714